MLPVAFAGRRCKRQKRSKKLKIEGECGPVKAQMRLYGKAQEDRR
jgi:hypothetical protein